MKKNDFKLSRCDNGIVVDYHELITWHRKVYKFEEMEELLNDLNMYLNNLYEIGDAVKIIKKVKDGIK